MLQRTMSLKEMMDYRPAAADFALCPEAVTGLIKRMQRERRKNLVL